MPLARSNTSRSKSGSPAPDFKHFTSPRPFLPPSHYAAAAGIPYNTKSTPRRDSGNSSDLDASFTSKDSLEDLPNHYNSFVPVSYPTELETTSDSSFEFKASSSRHGEKSSSSRRSTVRSKRQSHITGLPLLEAQLLPSLRDTIDRMTRPPSSAASSPSPAGATRLDTPKHSNSVRPTRSSSHSSDPPTSTTSRSTPQTSWNSPLAYTPTISESASPSLPVEDLTLRSKLPTKSALKSALRPPTPKLSSGPSPVAEAPVNSHSGGVSLKSVRNLCRKLSTGSLATSPMSSRKTNSKSSKPDISSPFRHVRKRSCTDPGSLSSVELPSLSDDSHIPLAPQTPVRTPKSNDPQPKLGIHKSNIPRPRAQSPWSSRSVNTEDSDLEFRYDAEGRNRRKLVVANAEVFPSSSESDVDNRGVYQEEAIDSNEISPWGPAETSRGNVGLGFDFGTAASSARDRRDIGGRHQQETKFAQGDTTWNSRTPTLPARGMRVTGRRPDQDDGQARGGTRDSNAGLDEEHQRRRAALMGIVSGLELGPGPSGPVAGESEESEYFGEEGFAISELGEFTGRIAQHDEMSDDGSVYGDGEEDEGDQHEGDQHLTPMIHHQGEERRRSSCAMPTFVLSTEDSGSHIYSHGQGDTYLTDRKSTSPRSSFSNLDIRSRDSSRSPIIRNENTSIPIPAALRSHSVYHRSLSPRLHLEAKENPLGIATSRRLPRSPSPSLPPNSAEKQHATSPVYVQPRARNPRRDRESEQSDAVLIAERSHAAAARERRAFGIPPSESVEVYQQRASQLLSRADSNLSSVGSDYWQEEGELSTGAETLFRRLGAEEISCGDQSQQSHIENVLQFTALSRSSSTASLYDDQRENEDWQSRFPQAEHGEGDHRGDATGSARRSAGDEDLEAKRQELIRELCQTEGTFVERLHVFVRLFVLPLRVQDSKVWISGVPSEVARLFDWLEDIMNLHNQMLSAFQAARRAQHPVVERIAESIRAFIPRFEVYQPYLVRLVDVLSLIEQLVQDETSDFGEFVDIQQNAPECDDWSYQMFLNEPVSRLAKYPDFFSRLLMFTPKTHPDYLSTFSLVHSTGMVIHVLNEVKVREDEYDLIKSFSARIQGLPSSVQLATRERRLLFYGLLHLVNTDKEVKSVLTTSTAPPDDSRNRKTNPFNRSSRLAVAINQWDARRGRSESASSSSTGNSLHSWGTSSGASSDIPGTSCSTFFASYRIPIPDGRLNNTSNRIPASPSPNPRRNSTTCGTPVQVFIFTDLVVLTTPSSSLAPTTGNWTLLKNIGIARILGVCEQLEQEPSSDPSPIALEILPVDVSEMNHGVSRDNGSLTVLRFIVPSQRVPALSEKMQAPAIEDELRRAWVSAFQQCFRYTLHLISLPPSASYDPQLNLAIDTHQTVFSLLASGLPLPKSPSVQEADFQRGQTTDSAREEREERGWWSVRFQQVFRELQRQDMALLSVTTSF